MPRILLVFLIGAAACGGSLGGPSDASPPAGPASTPTPSGQDAGAPDAGVPQADAGQPDDAGPPGPTGPTLAGCPIFPADSDWNRDVSAAPVDPRSDAYMAFMGASYRNLHADFGANPAYGIPYVVVPGSQPRLPVTFLYSGESDPGPYPYPPDLPIQGGWDAPGDRHAIALDRDACILYETYDTHWTGTGYSTGSGAVFNLRSGALRPDGWTSATASGLPILPGLARYDEVAEAREIKHALTFTAGLAARAWVHPATHYGNSGDANAPPMGTRVRLKAGFDLSRFTGGSRVILTALQRYGMFLVDEANDGFAAISGATDGRWDDRDLDQLKTVPFSAFEVVQLPQVHAR